MVRQERFQNRPLGDFFYEEEDLLKVQSLEHDATNVMNSLEDKISSSLLFMLNQQLLGFSSQMQQELALDIVDFVCDNIVRTTGCPSADYVLMICYAWIADEICGYQLEGGAS